jgi:DNA-binding GntR family transcriptional regulator
MKALSLSPGLTARVYAAILDEIVEGALAPGEHLVQEQLAADLGVSRQPVQQAMVLLKADGLVEEIGTRGLRVAGLDLRRMRHHYDLRAVLDGYGARAATCGMQSDADAAAKLEARARKILAAGDAAIENKSVRDLIRHDEALHKLIYTFSGNPVLSDTAEPHWRFLRRAMADVLRHAEPPQRIWDQHAAIIDAVLAGDADRAERLAKEHVQVAAAMLMEAFERREALAGASVLASSA